MVGKKFDSLRENFLTEPTVKKKARCLKKFSLPIMAVIWQRLDGPLPKTLHKGFLYITRWPSDIISNTEILWFYEYTNFCL